MKTFASILMGICLLTATGLTAKELIENGEFTAENLDDWQAQTREGYAGELKIRLEENGIMRVEVVSASNHSYAVVAQNIDLKEGETYRVVLEVQATGEDKVMRSSINWNYPEHRYSDAGYGERIKLTKGEWTRVEHTFTANKPVAKKPYGVLNLLVGKLNHDLLVRKVSIREIKKVGDEI